MIVLKLQGYNFVHCGLCVYVPVFVLKWLAKFSKQVELEDDDTKEEEEEATPTWLDLCSWDWYGGVGVEHKRSKKWSMLVVCQEEWTINEPTRNIWLRDKRRSRQRIHFMKSAANLSNYLSS